MTKREQIRPIKNDMVWKYVIQKMGIIEAYDLFIKYTAKASITKGAKTGRMCVDLIGAIKDEIKKRNE